MTLTSVLIFETGKTHIETLIQQCLTAQGQAVAPYEAEIDAICDRLYGLTDADLNIIRGEG